MSPAGATCIMTLSTQIRSKRRVGLGGNKFWYGHIEFMCLRDIQVKLTKKQLEI